MRDVAGARVSSDADVWCTHFGGPADGKYFRPCPRRGLPATTFNVHDVSVQDLNGQLHLEQHLELDEQLSMIAGP